jgi:hypothetical protein
MASLMAVRSIAAAPLAVSKDRKGTVGVSCRAGGLREPRSGCVVSAICWIVAGAGGGRVTETSATSVLITGSIVQQHASGRVAGSGQRREAGSQSKRELFCQSPKVTVPDQAQLQLLWSRK